MSSDDCLGGLICCWDDGMITDESMNSVSPSIIFRGFHFCMLIHVYPCHVHCLSVGKNKSMIHETSQVGVYSCVRLLRSSTG